MTFYATYRHGNFISTDAICLFSPEFQQYPGVCILVLNLVFCDLPIPEHLPGGPGLAADGRVTFENVPSYLMQKHVALQLPGNRLVHGDVAWGGNWFYICHDHGLTIELTNLQQLEALSHQVRAALRQQNITGEHGAEIDHVELVGPASSPLVADARNRRRGLRARVEALAEKVECRRCTHPEMIVAPGPVLQRHPQG